MDRSKRLFIAAVTCFVMVTVALSQSKQTDKKTQPQDDQSIQLQSQLLEIHAVVTDKKGNVIKNLKKEDFEISENNSPQVISFFSSESIPISTTGTEQPSNIGLLPYVVGRITCSSRRPIASRSRLGSTMLPTPAMPKSDV